MPLEENRTYPVLEEEITEILLIRKAVESVSLSGVQAASSMSISIYFQKNWDGMF